MDTNDQPVMREPEPAPYKILTPEERHALAIAPVEIRTQPGAKTWSGCPHYATRPSEIAF